MTNRMYWTAFIVSLGTAIILAPNESFGRAGAAAGGKSAPARAAPHRSVMRVNGHLNFSSIRDHRVHNAGWGLWPTAGGYYGTNQSLPPSNVEPGADVAPSISQHITYTYDVPWDAVHRYPQVVRYASGCRSQTVIVPRGYGKKQSVNIVRCY